MSSKRFHIEIEIDNVRTEEQAEAAVEAIRIAARQAFASLMLILGDNPKPEIAVWGEDFENGRTAMSLKEQEDE